MKKLNLRRVHEVHGYVEDMGSLAELNQKLVGQGFFYVPKKKSYSETGVAVFRSESGMKKIMKRIELGKEPYWMKPTTSGGMTRQIRTAGTPDVWAILRPKGWKPKK